MTNEEVLKQLEIVIKKDKNKVFPTFSLNYVEMAIDCLSVINRQQAEIEKLKKDLETEKLYHQFYSEITEKLLNAINQPTSKIEAANNRIVDDNKTIKSEAYHRSDFICPEMNLSPTGCRYLNHQRGKNNET